MIILRLHQLYLQKIDVTGKKQTTKYVKMMNMKLRKAKQGVGCMKSGLGHYCKKSSLPMTTMEVSHHRKTTTALAFDNHKHFGDPGHLMVTPSPYPSLPCFRSD